MKNRPRGVVIIFPSSVTLDEAQKTFFEELLGLSLLGALKQLFDREFVDRKANHSQHDK